MAFAIEQYNAGIETARQAELAARRERQGKPPVAPRKPGSLKPFKHADEHLRRMTEAYVEHQGDDFSLKQALAAIPPYRSHGHGGKHRTRNRLIGARWSQDRSKYSPHQGKSECGRRVFQRLPARDRARVRLIEVQI